ncbi:hypothetical protein M8J77_009088 [Diaphorina citri]|nr:hypothetical protein M8J77_009088 [Diaphorina citri]
MPCEDENTLHLYEVPTSGPQPFRMWTFGFSEKICPCRNLEGHQGLQYEIQAINNLSTNPSEHKQNGTSRWRSYDRTDDFIKRAPTVPSKDQIDDIYPHWIILGITTKLWIIGQMDGFPV